MVKRKQVRLRINQISYQGSYVTDENEIRDSVVCFFSNHLEGDILVLEDSRLVFPTPKIFVDQNKSLCKIPSTEELKKVVDSLKPNSAPGTDGYTGMFFQSCWKFLKHALLEGVIDYFAGSNLPPSFSQTLLALIPKNESPQDWGDFRPISLCSNLQKILSKLLNDRLSLCLLELISENQSGFLKNRAIIDNILLAQELAFGIDTKVRGSNVIVNLGMMKAYDRVI